MLEVFLVICPVGGCRGHEFDIGALPAHNTVSSRGGTRSTDVSRASDDAFATDTSSGH